MTTTDPVLSLHRQAIYNPGRLTDAEVKASFIARQGLFEELLDDIRSSRPDGRPQHHLIVGQRGMGKTTLLRRLDVATREEPDLAGFIPLGFPEEQWTIDRLSKLWLNCLDSLAETLEREGKAEKVINDIDASVDALRSDQEGEALLAEATEREFLRHAKLIGRRPVLLIDNLDLVFSRLENHEQNRLRSFLMAAGSPILIGTCVSPPDETMDYSAPFYDHFKTHYLERLSLEEMLEVLRRLAKETGHSEILGQLSKEWPRLKTLHALTGANPRTIAILFQIISQGFSREAYQDLEALLDWITPFYKARFEELPDQAQLIVSELATHWEPASSRKLGELTRLKNSQISSQIDRLRKAGIVEVVPIDPETRQGPLISKAALSGRNGYQLAERFFNIWFLMRQATRRDRRNLIFLTRFIECTHTPTERSEMAREMLSRRLLSREEHIYGLALEPTVSEHSLRYQLHDHVQQEIVDASRELKQKIDELIDPSEIPEHRYTFADVRAKLKKAVPKDSGIAPEDFVDAMLSSTALLDRRDAIASQALSASKARELLKIAENDRHLNESFAGHEAAEWYGSLLRLGTLVDAKSDEQFAEAVRRADTWNKIQLCIKCTASTITPLYQKDLWTKVKRLAFTEPGFDEAKEWKQWGDILQSQFQRYGEAEAAYRRAIELDSDVWKSWSNLGILYQDHLGRYSDSEQAYRRAIELNSGAWQLWTNLGDLYQYDLERYSDSEQAYRRAIELDSDAWETWLGLGDLYRTKLARFSDAEIAYRRGIAQAGDINDFPLAMVWNSFGLLLADQLGRGQEADLAFRRSIKADPENMLAPRYNLVSVLRDQLNRMAEAEKLAEDLPLPEARTLRAGIALHSALFAAHKEEWDNARTHLGNALDLIADQGAFPKDTSAGWIRATAVLVHLGYGDRLLEFLRERGDSQRLRPWYEAIRAQLRGDRLYLRNIPAEMRDVAGVLHDQIQTVLGVLPDSTRRWTPPGLLRKRTRK